MVRFVSGYLLCMLFVHLYAKPLFEMTPQMYASLMTQSLANNLPQKFTHKKLELTVTKMHQENHQIHFEATTPHYKGIVEELKKYRALPEDLKKQCREFSQLSFVTQGVQYVLHVNVKNEKPLLVIYDKEACSEHFDPQKKIFIGGYNRYGEDPNGYTQKALKR